MLWLSHKVIGYKYVEKTIFNPEMLGFLLPKVHVINYSIYLTLYYINHDKWHQLHVVGDDENLFIE